MNDTATTLEAIRAILHAANPEDAGAIIACVSAWASEARNTDKSVAVTFATYAGNQRAGSKTWAKRIDTMRPSRGNGYDFTGEFIAGSVAASGTVSIKEGTFLIVSASGGSHKNRSTTTILLQVEEGANYSHESGYQTFAGDGATLIATSDDVIDPQKMIDAHPDLDPFVGKPMAPLALALRERGL